MGVSIKTIIVDKTGNLKESLIKDFNAELLFKKCGFKKNDHFDERCEWKTKIDGTKYYINLYAKDQGKANFENKYDFPPPVDTTLFFGNCILVCFLKKDSKIEYVDLSLKLWAKIYEKLFGGFEDLNATCLEDDEEEDELDNIPKEKKTKDGYLKDGFVVDSSGEDEDEDEDYSEESIECELINKIKEPIDDDEIIDIGSE